MDAYWKERLDVILRGFIFLSLFLFLFLFLSWASRNNPTVPTMEIGFGFIGLSILRLILSNKIFRR